MSEEDRDSEQPASTETVPFETPPEPGEAVKQEIFFKVRYRLEQLGLLEPTTWPPLFP